MICIKGLYTLRKLQSNPLIHRIRFFYSRITYTDSTLAQKFYKVFSPKPSQNHTKTFFLRADLRINCWSFPNDNSVNFLYKKAKTNIKQREIKYLHILYTARASTLYILVKTTYTLNHSNLKTHTWTRMIQLRHPLTGWNSLAKCFYLL